LPSEIKELYTIVNSVEYKKKRSYKSNEAKSNTKPGKNDKKSGKKMRGS
jgi:hypothetical protein